MMDEVTKDLFNQVLQLKLMLEAKYVVWFTW